MHSDNTAQTSFIQRTEIGRYVHQGGGEKEVLTMESSQLYCALRRELGSAERCHILCEYIEEVHIGGMARDIVRCPRGFHGGF